MPKKLAPLSIALVLTGAAAWYYRDVECTECHSVPSAADETDSPTVYQPTGLTTTEQSLSTLTPGDALMAEMPDPAKLVPQLPALANQLPGMMAPMPGMGPMGMMPVMPSTPGQMPGMPGIGMPSTEHQMPGMPSPGILAGEQSLPHGGRFDTPVLPNLPGTNFIPGGLTPATN